MIPGPTAAPSETTTDVRVRPGQTARDRRRRAGVRARVRCQQRRGRRVGEQRPVGQRAQGPDRDDRAEPRQGTRRHGLLRPAAGPREFDRLLACGVARNRECGVADRAVHRRGPLRGPARSRRARHRAAGPESLSPLADHGRRGGRHRQAYRARRLRHLAGDHELGRRVGVGEPRALRRGQQPRLRRWLPLQPPFDRLLADCGPARRDAAR